MAKSVWKNFTEEQRIELARRRYVEGVSVDELAAETGMNSITLNRQLQNLRPRVLDESGSTEKKISQYIKEYPRVLMNSAVFDIETTDFSAGGIDAHLVTCVTLPLNSDTPKIIQIEFKDKRNDRRILKEVLEELSKYQILIGHYITGFDLPYLNTRLAYHGLPNLKGRFLVYDTFFAAKRMGLKSHRKSLAFLADFFHLENKKTSIYPVAWSHIDSPDEAQFLYTRKNIIDHCVGDVEMNRQIFDALWPLDRVQANMPVYRR